MFMYRDGGRNKNLAVNVKSRIGSVWLDSREYVDDGRGEERRDQELSMQAEAEA